jgi:ribosomal protein L22
MVDEKKTIKEIGEKGIKAEGYDKKKDTTVEQEVKKDIETKEEVKTEKKVEAKKKSLKKDVAVANGFSLRISPKQCVFICRIIRGKSPDAAVKRLQDVVDEKRPVPMAGLEVGHKKGKGLAGGKFPKNACKAIIEIVKQAKANAVVAEIENPVISVAKSDRASAPFKKGGRRAKRAHICIEIAARGTPSKKGTKVPSSSGGNREAKK